MILVVVDPPVPCQHLGLEKSVEELTVQVLVAHATVERLDPSVLPRLTGQSRPIEVRSPFCSESRLATRGGSPKLADLLFVVSHLRGDNLKALAEVVELHD
jgi:hypothetical protein